VASVFEVLAEPRRRQILDLVRDGESSVNVLVARLQMNQPAVSKHLRVLREAGLVSVRLDKNRRLYRARADRLAELRAMLDEFWGSRLATLRAELACEEGTRP
jgi:DNA-binding transcriptional ArsR family regulator